MVGTIADQQIPKDHERVIALLPFTSMKMFYRIQMHGHLIYSRLYKKVMNRNNVTIAYKKKSSDNTHFGFTEYFFRVNTDEYYAMITPITIENLLCSTMKTVDHEFSTKLPQVTACVCSNMI